MTTAKTAAFGGRFAPCGASHDATGWNVNIFEVLDPAGNVINHGGTLGVMNSTLWCSSGLDTAEWSLTPEGLAHVVATSHPVNFYDYATKQQYHVRLVVSLTHVGASGQGGYKVVREDTGAVVNQTTRDGISLTSDHAAYAEIAFTYGALRIS